MNRIDEFNRHIDRMNQNGKYDFLCCWVTADYAMHTFGIDISKAPYGALIRITRDGFVYELPLEKSTRGQRRTHEED